MGVRCVWTNLRIKNGDALNITIKFVPFVTGSPFTCSVIDVGSLCVDWDSIRLRPVHCPVSVVFDTKGSPEAEVVCTVSGRFLNDFDRLYLH